MRSSSSTSRGAFTLIEVLVVIVIVSVLLTLTLPALRGVRGNAQTSVCVLRLGSFVQGYAVLANQNGGTWLNYVPLNAASETVEDNGNAYGVPYYGQVRMWAAGLQDIIWQHGDSGEVFSCPALYRQSDRTADGERVYDFVPFRAGLDSYYYSVAFISSVSLWDPANAQGRAEPDAFRARVGLHQVVFPAQKVVMSETAAHHTDMAPCYTSGSAVLNCVNADGHAGRRTATNGNGALVWSQPPVGFPGGLAVPFSSGPKGVAGRDE